MPTKVKKKTVKGQRRRRFMSIRKRVETMVEVETQGRKRGVLPLDLHMPVVAFAPGSPLREAARIWWSPDGAAIEKLTKKVWGWPAEVDKLSGRTRNRSTRRTGRLRPIAKVQPPRATVRIVLDYPMTEPRTRIVTIHRQFPGEVFGLCHDFYARLYADDEASSTSLIYGHSLDQLTFRGVIYTPLRRRGKDGVEGEFHFEIGA